METDKIQEYQNYFFNFETEEILPFNMCISQKTYEEKYNSSDKELQKNYGYKIVFLGKGIGMNYDIYGNLLQWYDKEDYRFYKFE